MLVPLDGHPVDRPATLEVLLQLQARGLVVNLRHEDRARVDLVRLGLRRASHVHLYLLLHLL